MIKVKHLNKAFGGVPVLRDLNLTVNGPLVLMGPSGCGKTTLLRILMGLETPDSGTVQGVGNIGAVFQESRLCPQLTAVGNICLVGGVNPAQAQAELQTLGFTQAELALPVARLSGGQQRRTALLRALLCQPVQTLLLDDGKLELTVTGGRPGALFCTVVRGGTLESRKSLAAPGLDLHLPTLTDEDEENLALAKGCGVTGVMLPFVRGREDLEHLRAALHRAGADGARILAKIESGEGAEHLESLFGAADEIVIARGDLGNAMDLWQLPGVQRRMAAACRRAGVPFMVVTQMLDSMRENPVPTRAEVCDVYTAVMQGAASVMLTGETAAGKWPAEAINYLVKTGEEARRDRAAGEG